MNNELERILGEVADGASRRSTNLPVGELRGRGVRRRRTRQAGYSAVGVAAAFGLAFGAAQILPGPGLVGPASSLTEEPLPTAGSKLPLGACGTDVTNMPTIDAQLSLRLDPINLEASVGTPPSLTMSLQNYGSTLDVTGSEAWVAVAKDGVVVGFMWRSGREPLSELQESSFTELEDFSAAVRCAEGEIAPTGDADSREALPAGRYEIFAMLGPTAVSADAEWAFDLVGDHGTLTILPEGEEPESRPTRSGTVDLGAREVNLPQCGETIRVFGFPQGTDLSSAEPLEVTVGHTGEDESGDPFFYGDGYGDQLQVSISAINTLGNLQRARELEARAVVARDGIVVAELSWPEWHEVEWNMWPLNESRAFSPTTDWVDCATGEHGQVPKGDYEILGWRTIEIQDQDGSTGVWTLGYEPVPFTAYDFEDPDNPGPLND